MICILLELKSEPLLWPFMIDSSSFFFFKLKPTINPISLNVKFDPPQFFPYDIIFTNYITSIF